MTKKDVLFQVLCAVSYCQLNRYKKFEFLEN